AVLVEKTQTQRMTIANVEEARNFSVSLNDVTADELAKFHPQDTFGSPATAARKARKAPRRPGISRRNTGYAFSCDEETTLAESFIATNHNEPNTRRSQLNLNAPALQR
ncbi:hypothetical protein DYB37_012440, partial [Aphanomyces astaci]